MTTCHDGYTPATLRGATDKDPLAPHRIVVGVDGSPESLAALRWAADQASLSGSRLEAVNVYEPVAEISFAFGGYPAVNPIDPAMAKHSALVALETCVHRVMRDEDDVEMVALADGSPSKALTHLATGADMLVLGAHHRHGLGLLLGSTAASCVRHAICPVVVVPTGESSD
jgi:nucleotide-binding universal stress UspA family protein